MPALSIGAAVVGGLIQNRNTKKAVNSQEDSSREALAFQQRQADQARADSEPWRIAGGNALTRLAAGTAEGGEYMRNFGAADFQADPGYQFRLAEGQRGLNNSLASRGMALSGAALKASSTYSQNMASQEYGNAYNRFNANRDAGYNKLASLAGIGQVVARENGQNAMQIGQQGAQGIMGAGNARASGYLAQGSNWGNMLNQSVSAWNNREKPPTYGMPNASNVEPNGYNRGY